MYETLGSPVPPQIYSTQTMAASTREFDLDNVADVTHVESPEKLNEADKVIVVMGSAEEAKTKFIQRAGGKFDLGLQLAQSSKAEFEKLEPTSAGRAYAKRLKFTGTSTELVLVVAPTLEDTDKTDWDVLLAVARWFNTGKRFSSRLPMIAGVLYHFRTGRNTPHRSFGDEASLSLLQQMFGEDFYDKILFVENVESEEAPTISNSGEDNDFLLGVRIYWEYMEACGSRSCKFDGTLGSAQRIIDSVTKPVVGLRDSSTSESERAYDAPLRRLDYDDAKWESISGDYLSENDRVILIMGPSDSGKRKFFQSVLGDTYPGDELDTRGVKALRVNFGANIGHELVLVDVPGFDGLREARKTLDAIISWFKDAGKDLSSSSIVVPRISGIIYLRPVGDSRLEEHVADLNDEMLQKFCGKLFYGKVLLAMTTHSTDPEEEKLRKLRNLRTWRVMTVLGSKARRFTGTRESARSLIQAVVDAESRTRGPLQQRMMNVQIQQEVVLDRKAPQETRSGQYLEEYLRQQSTRGPDYIGSGKLTLKGLAFWISKRIVRTVMMYSNTMALILRALGLSPPSLPTFSERNFDEIDEVAFVHAHDLDDNDTIIVVMGRTGSGRSTLIETVTGSYFSNEGVGHRLRSATSDVTALRIRFKESRNLVLVDTPGFGSACKSDYEILKIIAGWLNNVPINTSDRRRTFGILYLHRITDHQGLGGSAAENLRMLEKHCDFNLAVRVKIVTTHWPDERFQDPEELKECEELEEVLQREYSNPKITSGSKVQRFYRTSSSAEALINEVIAADFKSNLLVEIQREMLRQGKSLPKAEAGNKTLNGPLKELLEQQNRVIKSLTKEFDSSGETESKEIQRLLKELDDLQQKIDDLKRSSGTRNLRFRAA
ncbi:hypothetical protein NP233_g11626 [Leucocoprinus birnbaumii]|uniref:G domain-containing protein n=1 Tax=Leucocoprinus birnbaumii TaxID=56174 RepID=A0AAD5VM00_9AGAR|nr:hypothetical protein NP233_g11626 [Leucocoprinus birnbaumii]